MSRTIFGYDGPNALAHTIGCDPDSRLLLHDMAQLPEWSNEEQLQMKTLCLLLVFATFSQQALAEVIRQPKDLEPGDKYRLAFLTSKSRDATSANIAVYDAFVQSVADSAPEVGSWGITWQVLGSTAAVDARDHTNTHPDNDESLPIYRLDGTRLVETGDPMGALSNRALWVDQALNDTDDGFRLTELGTIATSLDVWTGTFIDGQAANPFGSTSVNVGRADSGPLTWFENTGLRSTNSLPFYAISETLTAVPEPASSSLFLLGSLVLMQHARRR